MKRSLLIITSTTCSAGLIAGLSEKPSANEPLQ